jgi:ribokinase
VAPDFVVCGNLTIDDVVTADGAVAADQCGGNGLFAALGMWLWQESVGLVAGAGTDYPGAWLEQLAQAGIDTAGVYAVPEPHALRSRVFYREDGSRTDRLADVTLSEPAAAVIDQSSDFSAMGSAEHRRAWPLYSPSPARVPREWSTAAGYHLSPGPHEHVTALAATLRASSPQAVITIDWPWWNAAEDGFAHELLAAASAVLPGAEELAHWPVAGTAEQTEKALASLSPVVVVKRGSRGSDVYDNGRRTHVPVRPTAVIDPTGAGDAFCGGFVVGLARTGDPVEAARCGSVSASYVIEAFGALDVLRVDRELVPERLEELKHKAMTKGAV